MSLFIGAQIQIYRRVSLHVSLSLTPREFNSYGARRGNDAVMTRGTFASIKLQNRFIGKPGPKTLHIPTSQTVSGDPDKDLLGKIKRGGFFFLTFDRVSAEFLQPFELQHHVSLIVRPD